MRGAIANLVLDQFDQANIRNQNLQTNGGDFRELFLSDNPAIFQNLYPAVATRENGNQEYTNAPVYWLPATALSSKTNSGFISQSKNGVFDTLIDRFCADQLGWIYDPVCPKDGGRLDSYSTFFSRQDGKYYPHKVSKRILTRVGINRHRSTAEDDVLYSLEVINEQYPTKDNNKLVWQNMKFAGGIVVPTEELADRLLQFINCNCEHLRIGTSTSRGLGKVRITATAPQKDNSLENRLHKFQAALENRAQMWQQAISNNKEILETHRFYFVVGLQSDAILEENWHKTMVVSPTMLASYANIADPSLKLHTAYSSYSYRSGWNSAWGLLKDVELVTNKGSVYLFSCDKAMMGEWLGRLQILEMVGIGRRTVEGFGQMRVSDEFHSVFREEVV